MIAKGPLQLRPSPDPFEAERLFCDVIGAAIIFLIETPPSIAAAPAGPVMRGTIVSQFPQALQNHRTPRNAK